MCWSWANISRAIDPRVLINSSIRHWIRFWASANHAMSRLLRSSGLSCQAMLLACPMGDHASGNRLEARRRRSASNVRVVRYVRGPCRLIFDFGATFVVMVARDQPVKVRGCQLLHHLSLEGLRQIHRVYVALSTGLRADNAVEHSSTSPTFGCNLVAAGEMIGPCVVARSEYYGHIAISEAERAASPWLPELFYS